MICPKNIYEVLGHFLPELILQAISVWLQSTLNSLFPLSPTSVINLEKTTLYKLIEKHLLSFYQHIDNEQEKGLPDFVKKEFEAFLKCGLLCHGFLRLQCESCRQEKLVAFSGVVAYKSLKMEFSCLGGRYKTFGTAIIFSNLHFMKASFA